MITPIETGLALTVPAGKAATAALGGEYRCLSADGAEVTHLEKHWLDLGAFALAIVGRGLAVLIT